MLSQTTIAFAVQETSNTPPKTKVVRYYDTVNQNCEIGELT